MENWKWLEVQYNFNQKNYFQFSIKKGTDVFFEDLAQLAPIEARPGPVQCGLAPNIRANQGPNQKIWFESRATMPVGCRLSPPRRPYPPSPSSRAIRKSDAHHDGDAIPLAPHRLLAHSQPQGDLQARRLLPPPLPASACAP